MKPALIVMVDEQGKLVWEANLPLPWIVLALERIKLDIVTGKVKQAPALAVPTPGDIQAMRRNDGIAKP